MRVFLAMVVLPGLALAAILPDAVGPYHRVSAAAYAPPEKQIWDEYGLKESETASYENAGKRFTALSFRLRDTTGAMAAFEWQRDANSTPSKAAPLAAETPASLLVVRGNYLVSFTGYKPEAAELGAVLGALKNVDATNLPSLPAYFPTAGLVANSARYILGPASLQKFSPGIPPSVAAFHMGAEAAFGVFHSQKGDMAVALFNYPTNQMAMDRVGEFAKLPGAVTKRSGPLVAAIISPPDPDEAERLLAKVSYEAVITLNERAPSARDNIGNLITNVFTLIGILLVFSLVAGLFAGGFRRILRRGRKGAEAEPMILLHLGNHRP
jgi:hypothetical protein